MTTNTEPNFAKNFRAARLRAGVSQGAVARVAGLDVRTVSRVESGESLPRIDTADALALAVGSSLDELLERGNETRRAGATSPNEASPADKGV